MRSCTLREHRRRHRNEIFCPKQLNSYMHYYLEEYGKTYNGLVSQRNCSIKGLSIVYNLVLLWVQLNYWLLNRRWCETWCAEASLSILLNLNM